MSTRPLLLILAGVNGAGKSSVFGYVLESAGESWFNPDAFAREWRLATGCAQEAANAAAWQEGLRRLDFALARRINHAFETTLGGHTIPTRIKLASATHDVLMWFCGLSSPELHLKRVKARVRAGGHDIPEVKVRERYVSSVANLVALLPCLAHLTVYDNSAQADRSGRIPDPVRVLEMNAGRTVWPLDSPNLWTTPAWAKPLLEAALSMPLNGS